MFFTLSRVLIFTPPLLVAALSGVNRRAVGEPTSRQLFNVATEPRRE